MPENARLDWVPRTISAKTGVKGGFSTKKIKKRALNAKSIQHFPGFVGALCLAHVAVWQHDALREEEKKLVWLVEKTRRGRFWGLKSQLVGGALTLPVPKRNRAADSNRQPHPIKQLSQY